MCLFGWLVIFYNVVFRFRLCCSLDITELSNANSDSFANVEIAPNFLSSCISLASVLGGFRLKIALLF